MAKVTGPCLSLGAKGSVGKALTFMRKMGGFSVHSKEDHKDAKSYPQLLIRSHMRDAVKAWQALTPSERGEWNDFIAGKLEY